jgi:hypothetical protein
MNELVVRRKREREKGGREGIKKEGKKAGRCLSVSNVMNEGFLNS